MHRYFKANMYISLDTDNAVDNDGEPIAQTTSSTILPTRCTTPTTTG